MMRVGVRHFLFRHLPTLLWAALVAVCLGLPGGAVGQWSDRIWLPWVDPYLDKVVHFLLFAVMAVLAARSCAVLSAAGPVGRASARWPLLSGLLLASAFGGGGELAQLWLTSRSADWLDFVADVAGAGCAVAIAAMWSQQTSLRASASVRGAR